MGQRDFDLEEIVSGSVELVAEQAYAKGLELVCQIPSSVPSRLEGTMPWGCWTGICRVRRKND